MTSLLRCQARARDPLVQCHFPSMMLGLVVSSVRVHPGLLLSFLDGIFLGTAAGDAVPAAPERAPVSPSTASCAAGSLPRLFTTFVGLFAIMAAGSLRSPSPVAALLAAVLGARRAIGEST